MFFFFFCCYLFISVFLFSFCVVTFIYLLHILSSCFFFLRINKIIPFMALFISLNPFFEILLRKQHGVCVCILERMRASKICSSQPKKRFSHSWRTAHPSAHINNKYITSKVKIFVFYFSTFHMHGRLFQLLFSPR